MNQVTVASSRFVLALSLFCAAFAARAQTSRQISADGTGVFRPAPLGNDAVQVPEIDDFGIDDADAAAGPEGDGFINRTLPGNIGGSASARAGKKAKSNPEVNVSFDGLNFRQQRLANNGNQFSVEPPDQGLCAGNGFVLESVNDVVNVFDAAGNQRLGVTDLNSFYGYPAAIARGNPNRFGPSLTDPTCLFDRATQRWFQVVLTLDRINVDPATGLSLSQSLSGRNHLDIAVSNTASPLGTWTAPRARRITTAIPRPAPLLRVARIRLRVSATSPTSAPTPTGSTSPRTSSASSAPGSMPRRCMHFRRAIW